MINEIEKINHRELTARSARASYMSVRKSRRPIRARDVNVESSIVVNILTSIIVYVTTAEIWIIKAIVSISRSSDVAVE